MIMLVPCLPEHHAAKDKDNQGNDSLRIHGFFFEVVRV